MVQQTNLDTIEDMDVQHLATANMHCHSGVRALSSENGANRLQCNSQSTWTKTCIFSITTCHVHMYCLGQMANAMPNFTKKKVMIAALGQALRK
jgi:hypothetical protein